MAGPLRRSLGSAGLPWEAVLETTRQPHTPFLRIGVAAAVVGLVLLPGATPAAGDPVAAKRAEAAALAGRIDDQARRIVALDAEHRRAQRQLREAEGAVAQAEAELAAALRRLADVRHRLVGAAQDAYVRGGSVAVLRVLVGGDSSNQITRLAYLRVLTGQDRRLIGELHATREDLELVRGRLDAARRRAGAQADAIGTDRQALERAVQAQRANLAAVNGELADLVAAERARQAAAAPRPAPTTTAPAPAAPAASPPTTAMPNADAWACIRQLESGNNYASPSGGAYQFLDSTWQSLGYSGTASDAPPAVQDEAAVRLQARSGWGQWTVAPLCGLM